jgi:Zn-finger nucleic acid-binding protein
MAGIAVGFMCPLCRYDTTTVEAYREAGGLDLKCCKCRWEWTEDPYLEQLIDNVA